MKTPDPYEVYSKWSRVINRPTAPTIFLYEEFGETGPADSLLDETLVDAFTQLVRNEENGK